MLLVFRNTTNVRNYYIAKILLAFLTPHPLRCAQHLFLPKTGPFCRLRRHFPRARGNYLKEKASDRHRFVRDSWGDVGIVPLRKCRKRFFALLRMTGRIRNSASLPLAAADVHPPQAFPSRGRLALDITQSIITHKHTTPPRGQMTRGRGCTTY